MSVAGEPVAPPGTPAGPSAAHPNPGGDYGAASIKVLKGLEAVRKRPGMYIGDTDDVTGLHHLVYRARRQRDRRGTRPATATTISVVVHADDSVTVEDNGRGIPVGRAPRSQIASRRGRHDGPPRRRQVRRQRYKVSGGLHGVGVSVVNALASVLALEIKREGKVWRQTTPRRSRRRRLAEIGKTRQTGTKHHLQARPARSSRSPSYSFDVLASACASSRS